MVMYPVKYNRKKDGEKGKQTIGMLQDIETDRNYMQVKEDPADQQNLKRLYIGKFH